MSETNEEELYGLIEVTERQQQVAQLALEGMVKERIALGEALQRFTDDVMHLREEIRTLVSDEILATRSSAEEAGAAAARGAMESLNNVLDDVSEQAGATEAALRGIVSWLSWRFLWLGLAGIASLGIMSWLASCAVLWWDTSAIGRAQVRKAQLESEVARLEESWQTWVDAGMAANLGRCGPRKRPCVKIDERAGVFGEEGDYRIIQRD